MPDRRTVSPKPLAADVPLLLPWLRLALLIRGTRKTRWDDATWPTAKTALGKALRMQAQMRRRGWWN